MVLFCVTSFEGWNEKHCYKDKTHFVYLLGYINPIVGYLEILFYSPSSMNPHGATSYFIKRVKCQFLQSASSLTSLGTAYYCISFRKQNGLAISKVTQYKMKIISLPVLTKDDFSLLFLILILPEGHWRAFFQIIHVGFVACNVYNVQEKVSKNYSMPSFCCPVEDS